MPGPKLARVGVSPLIAAVLMTLIPGSAIGQAAQGDVAWDAPHAGNPVLPGYFADPSVLQHDGKVYIYATIDPWGGDELGVWESSDWRNWTFRRLNWPTRAATTSPTGSDAKVWAPSVVRGPDGRFYMYVSVGSEVWAGVADNPLGPWSNLLRDRPLIPRTLYPQYHMIDAEVFIDTDGAAYLYWGSGLNWVNGRCFVVKLRPDMVTFDGEPKDVTPSNYFEGPFMFKAGGRYYLTYSNGKTIDETYEVRYAVGASPLGPFVEPSGGPLLSTDKSKAIVSPGHHAIFLKGGRPYILYHRHSVPFVPGEVGRQVAIDRLDVLGDRLSVRASHEGPAWLRPRRRQEPNLAAAKGVSSSASSAATQIHRSARVLDNNYATLWRPSKNDPSPWLQIDLGRVRQLRRSLLRPEFASEPLQFTLQTSRDGKTWRNMSPQNPEAATGSPLVLEHLIAARYLRLSFPPGQKAGVFEWAVR